MDFINYFWNNVIFDLSLLLELLIFIFVIKLACRYHLERFDCNSKLLKFINWESGKRYILKKDFEIKFFCRQEFAKKVFTIPAGSVFIMHERRAFFKLKGKANVPENIKINYGTEVHNVFVFCISSKFFEKSDLPISKVSYKVFNITEKKMEICVGF